jgi:DMSO/TMAO reductase YedYZ heme-binding membrane subunit
MDTVINIFILCLCALTLQNLSFMKTSLFEIRAEMAVMKTELAMKDLRP